MLDDKKYSIYIKSVINLVKSLVILNEEHANSINIGVIRKFGINNVNSDKTSWKYYLNIFGEYHHTDTVINVISLDTKEKIVDAGKADTFSAQIRELYPDGIPEVTMNDLLWFDWNWCFELVGISDCEEDEEDEDTLPGKAPPH